MDPASNHFDTRADVLNVDPKDLSTREIYSLMVGLIHPRPIAWVSTLSNDGTANLAPYSFFNGVGANPPTVMFCPANKRDGSYKDSHQNVLNTGEFVVNIVTDPFAESMNLTAAELDAGADEFEFAKLEKVPSLTVDPPRVQNVVAAIECVLHTSLALGHGPGGANLVIGRVTGFFVDNEVIDGSSIKSDSIPTVGRMGGNEYVHTTNRFAIPRPSS